MDREFHDTPEDLAKIVLDLEKCSQIPDERSAIETYAHGLIRKGFSRKSLGSFLATTSSYFQNKGYGELTPDDVGRIGICKEL